MLRKETVEPATLELLKKIVSLPELSQFRLVGGTALSLMLGHRKSIDLDFFSDEPIEIASIISLLNDNFDEVMVLNNKGKAIFQCTIQGIKVDFVAVKDKFNYPVNIIEQIPFADIKDITALKLNAIKGRGAKKDFWDIEKLLQIFTLENILQFYLDRYSYDDTFAVLRSIIYFEDAEEDPDPEIIEKTTWDTVKSNITKSFDNYYKEQKNT